MENNQSPPFHRPYAAPLSTPSNPLTSNYHLGYLPFTAIQNPSGDPYQPSRPSGPPLPPVTPLLASQLSPRDFQDPRIASSLETSPPHTEKNTVPASTPTNTSIATLAPSSSLPSKPKKAKTAARLAREMARKLKHRERRRMGRRERRMATANKKTEEEGEGLEQSDDGLENGSESGELDSGSPQDVHLDRIGATDRPSFRFDGGDGREFAPKSPGRSVQGDDYSSVERTSTTRDDSIAFGSRRSSTMYSGAEDQPAPYTVSRVTYTDDRSDWQRNNPPSRDTNAQFSGLRSQPPSGPRHSDNYQFGRDRGVGRNRRDEETFNFQSDNRGLQFPATEPSFRDRRYRDNDRRFGDRRGFHTDSFRPFRENDRERPVWVPTPAHDRPILHLGRASTPEQFPAMVAAKRQRMDEGEMEMDIDSRSDSSAADKAIILPSPLPEDNQDAAPPSAQLALEEEAGAKTALPENPANDTAAPGKKMDVISMIRQAKKELLGDRKDITATAGDFISLSGLDDEIGNSSLGVAHKNIPTGPKASRHSRDFDSLHATQPIDRGIAPGTTGPSPSMNLAPPPGLGLGTIESKKRTFTQMEPPPPVALKQFPWLHPRGLANHPTSLYLSTWLHKEIIDFYNFIKPQPYEHIVRHDLVRRLRDLVQSRFDDADIQAFGSFAAEIYLPNSDMDIVLLSRQYLESARPKYDSVPEIRKLAKIIRNSDLPQPGTLITILSAKVPIIKYKDRLTGLSVDISFENPSGLVAIRTFRQWREIYPEMPKLALLLKHFLATRSINEPFNGGLGSFSVICMIVSLLQMMPEASSGNWHEGENVALGRALMEFLDLYGTKFNTETTGISVRRPGYFKKSNRRELHNPSKPFLLAIEDPNDPTNNISKATYRILDIQKAFANTYRDLNDRINTLHAMPFKLRRYESILAPMFAHSDYSQINNQRAVMRRVFLSRRLGTQEELTKLGGRQESPATYTASADGSEVVLPTPEWSGGLVADAVLDKNSKKHSQKALKKQRRAAKVKNRSDQPSNSSAHKRKKDRKPRKKGKQAT